MRAGPSLFPPPPYHYHERSGEEHYSKNMSAESKTFICFLYISQYTPMLPRWWEIHSVLPSLHHPLTSVISEGLRDRTQSRIFTQTPPHILGSHKSPGMAYCPGLHISFSPQLGTMFEQHTPSVLCVGVGGWGRPGMTQVSHLGLSDSYSPTIFQGFPSLTNPQNLVSLEPWRVLESLFPSHLTLFCHLPHISCCQWAGASGKKDWLGWRGLAGGRVEGRSGVQWCMKLTLTTKTNAKLQLCGKLGRRRSWCHGGIWEDFPRDCQWTEIWIINKSI